MAIYGGTLIRLTFRLYNNLKFKYFEKKKLVKTITFSKKYLKSKLLSLDLSMRFSLDLITDIQIREWFVWSFKDHDWYPIPNDSTVLKNEFKRVLGSSIISAIDQGKSHLMKLKRRFMQYWALSFNEPNKLRSIPLFHAINNWVKQVDVTIKEIRSNDLTNVTLLDIYKLINFIDINEIFCWDRDFHARITQGGRLLTTSRSKIRETHEHLFIYDIHGSIQELDNDLYSILSSCKQFLDYTTVIEKKAAKPLPAKQVEMFKQLANRHGYSFLE